MAKVKEWLTGPSCSIYSCHFLASWSGRMFAFSLGLFLIDVSPDSLQLTATHGLCIGAAVLLLASLLGDWVDRTPRLKAALMSMILQNCLMTSCAGVLLLLLVLQSELGTMISWLRHLFFAIIISLSVSSRLMKVARVIVVERDWIVEISKKDEDHLAVMTSTFRRIDLLTKILAPIVTGQIMTYAGLKIGAGFIAVWSLTSLGAEFWLIRRVYSFVPALRSKKIATRFSEKNNDQNREATEKLQDKEVEKEPDREYRRDAEHTQPPRADDNKCSPWRVLDSFLVLYRGFRTYMSYEVKWAGFGLACLYLTVLGFDGITVGYATTQGLSGSVLGIMVGVGAVFGILATFAYPYIVRCLGLPRTGVLALGLQPGPLCNPNMDLKQSRAMH
ncbi:solute carrier family 40 member 1 [Aplysia californica]|uniref:Solute carrier family 40 member n=1 Tax=Aplysia californica TaxID=6500 RepID=A0ABM1VX68_APLCA|nr:solute carrier family 40 member 1 [Aplysia californica]